MRLWVGMKERLADGELAVHLGFRLLELSMAAVDLVAAVALMVAIELMAPVDQMAAVDQMVEEVRQYQVHPANLHCVLRLSDQERAKPGRLILALYGPQVAVPNHCRDDLSVTQCFSCLDSRDLLDGLGPLERTLVDLTDLSLTEPLVAGHQTMTDVKILPAPERVVAWSHLMSSAHDLI